MEPSERAGTFQRPMSAEPLFHEQMSLSWEIAAPVADDTSSPRLKSAAPLHDAVVMGASRDHQLVPDDEQSLSRIIQLHSEDKDHYAHYYADIVSSAMAGKFPALAWVELFAGPDACGCSRATPTSTAARYGR